MVKCRSHKTSYSSNMGHEFFKIYQPDQSSQQLIIPPAFTTRHLNGVLPCKCILRNRSNRAWSVHLKKVDGNLVIKQGWETFVEHNCLKYGDFLIFRSDGTSEIKVKVYSCNGCEKEDAVTKSEAVRVKSEESEEYDIKPDCGDKEADMPMVTTRLRSRGSRTVQGNQKTKTMKLKRVTSKSNASRRITRRASRTRGPPRKQQMSRPLKAGRFESKNNHFTVVMQASYVNCGLNIPLSFVREYLEEGRQDIILQVSNKLWNVKLIIYKDCAKFCKGWPGFAKDNNLRAGDACVFDLTNREDSIFEVSISRGLD